MLYGKKIKPGTGNGEEKPMDVSWLIYIGMAKLGYTEKEVYLMQVGKWMDLFETYKQVYNFETARQFYGKKEEEKPRKASAMDL